MALVVASSAADTSSLNRTLIHIQRPLALAPLTHHWQIITALSWPLLTRSYSKNLQKLSLWSAVICNHRACHEMYCF